MKFRFGCSPKEKDAKSCCCCICGMEFDRGTPMVEAGSNVIGGGAITAVPQI